MIVRNLLARLDASTTRSAIAAAVRARTWTKDDKATLDALVHERSLAELSAGRPVDPNNIRREVMASLTAQQLEALGQASKQATAGVAALRSTLREINHDARRPAPLPPVLSDAQRKEFLPHEAAMLTAMLSVGREVRTLSRHLEFAGQPASVRLARLEQADRDGDLELVHFLEPVLERELQTPPDAVPGDLDAYNAAKAQHAEFVSRLTTLREARVTEADRAALAEAHAEVATIEREWSRPGGEADLQRAVQESGRFVPEETAVA